MALTVRLAANTERVLDQLARRRGQTRSDLVREALDHYSTIHAAVADGDSALAAWVDVIGIIDSCQPGVDRTSGERFTDVVRKKARERRAR